jgi:hypothetical protein
MKLRDGPNLCTFRGKGRAGEDIDRCYIISSIVKATPSV